MTKFASTKGGIAIGLKGKRGHVVTKRTPRSKPSRTKGVSFLFLNKNNEKRIFFFFWIFDLWQKKNEKSFSLLESNSKFNLIVIVIIRNWPNALNWSVKSWEKLPVLLHMVCYFLRKEKNNFFFFSIFFSLSFHFNSFQFNSNIQICLFILCFFLFSFRKTYVGIVA